MKKQQSPPQITFDTLEIDTISETSGLFIKGPHTANHWRSYRKENTGWGHSDGSSFDGVHSILKDNDGVDYFDFKSGTTEE